MERLIHPLSADVVAGPDWAGVSCFCSTRNGGVSSGPWASLNVGTHTDDEPDHVFENRRRLVRKVGRPVIWLNQVHGTAVHDADTDIQPVHDGSRVPVKADAAVTTRSDRALAIMVADCLPVLFASTDGRVIGAAHAGWRGLAAGVLENTLAMMQSKHDDPADVQWQAWVGPAIARAWFDVGDEVRAAFLGTHASADSTLARCFVPTGSPGKWRADLPAIARYRLLRAGVARVVLSGLCTYGRSDLFYSYRRDGVTGRQVAFIWRNTPS